MSTLALTTSEYQVLESEVCSSVVLQHLAKVLLQLSPARDPDLAFKVHYSLVTSPEP